MGIMDNRIQRESEELLSYRRHIEQSAASMNGRLLLNGSPAHARIVIEIMFREALSHVALIADSRSDDIYNSPAILSEVSDFLERGGKLRVICEDHAHLNQEGFWSVVRDASNAEVRRLPESLVNFYEFHLLVADSKSFRYEKDKQFREAFISFGNQDNALKIENLFDDLWTRASKLENSELALNA